MGKPKGKKVAPTPSIAKKAPAAAKATNPLYEKRSRSFGIGGSIPPKKPLNRFVKWPKYVRIQRQKRILTQRLKVPPALNQFSKALDKNSAGNLFKLLMKYRPEDKAEKDGNTVESKKPVCVKFGLNHVTYLIEQGKAQLVLIAHDVDPIELVVWLPALCRKMNVPYAIVKGKARLGALVHQKTAAAVCITAVKNEDKHDFSKIVESVKTSFNDNEKELTRRWGGGIMGMKSQHKTRARERTLARESRG